MTRFVTLAILAGLVALPSAASAQHSRGADTPSVGTAVPSGSGSSGSSGSSSGNSGGSSSSGSSGSFSPGGRRGDRPANGTAVPRGSTGPGGTIVITPGSGFYPWGYPLDGGVGFFGGYYSGFYGAYDPWYGWFPTYVATDSFAGPDHTGSLRLKVKPEGASVYVDGFSAGVVDDFDGAFQRLKLAPGPHHIEIRAPERQPLAFDVMIQEDFTITYRGELSKK
jgi:hypothetical protein